jgi:hypothetical protein
MYPSEFMDQLVHDLIEYYEAEVLPSGLIYLELRMDGHGVLVIEEKRKHKQMRVCYVLYNAQCMPVPEPEILFYLDERSYWIPYEIRCHTLGIWAVADLDLGSGEPLIIDEPHQAALASLTDAWAEYLRAQGWIGGASKCITQQQVRSEGEETSQPPSEEELWDWLDEYGTCKTPDGCWVEPPEVCAHGHPSWLVKLGLFEAGNDQASPLQQDDLFG